MKRLILIVSVMLVGCGRQSFTEAEAIWKDETAKLEVMQKDWEAEVAKVYSDELTDRILEPLMKKIEADHPEAGLVELQRIMGEHEAELQAALEAAAKPQMDELR